MHVMKGNNELYGKYLLLSGLHREWVYVKFWYLPHYSCIILDYFQIIHYYSGIILEYWLLSNSKNSQNYSCIIPAGLVKKLFYSIPVGTSKKVISWLIFCSIQIIEILAMSDLQQDHEVGDFKYRIAGNFRKVKFSKTSQ